MHYAVIIPIKTREKAELVLTAVLASGMGAFIEERLDKDEVKS